MIDELIAPLTLEEWADRLDPRGAVATSLVAPLIAELRASRKVVEAAKECAINAGWNRECYMIAEERYKRLWDALHELDGSWLVNVKGDSE